jgi:hypothetical protein
MSAKRSHTGLAATQGHPQAPVDHPAVVLSPARPVCDTCGRSVHYRRRTYGPRGRAGGWSHTGDGLVQYRGWR